MSRFIIEGGHTLSGTITPQGAKNEALEVISAVLLTSEPVTISNVPEILDVKNLIGLLEGIGVKVTRLQEMLAYLGFMEPGTATGHFGDMTFEAVRSYQASKKLKASGVANRETQRRLEADYDKKYAADPDIWSVVDDD